MVGPDQILAIGAAVALAVQLPWTRRYGMALLCWPLVAFAGHWTWQWLRGFRQPLDGGQLEGLAYEVVGGMVVLAILLAWLGSNKRVGRILPAFTMALLLPIAVLSVLILWLIVDDTGQAVYLEDPLALLGPLTVPAALALPPSTHALGRSGAKRAIRWAPYCMALCWSWAFVALPIMIVAGGTNSYTSPHALSISYNGTGPQVLAIDLDIERFPGDQAMDPMVARLASRLQPTSNVTLDWDPGSSILTLRSTGPFEVRHREDLVAPEMVGYTSARFTGGVEAALGPPAHAGTLVVAISNGEYCMSVEMPYVEVAVRPGLTPLGTLKDNEDLCTH